MYLHCQAHAQIYSFWFDVNIYELYIKIDSKALFQTQAQISLIFDSTSIRRQANPDELGHCYVRSEPRRPTELSLKLIKSHHKSYIILYLLVLFTAKPKYLNVSLADGRDITTEIIGPFNEGHELRLVCESGGGKPIPRVTWYNGSSVISGMSFHDLFFYTTCIEYSGWLDGGGRLTEYNKATTTVFWKYLLILLIE